MIFKCFSRNLFAADCSSPRRLFASAELGTPRSGLLQQAEKRVLSEGPDRNELASWLSGTRFAKRVLQDIASVAVGYTIARRHSIVQVLLQRLIARESESSSKSPA